MKCTERGPHELLGVFGEALSVYIHTVDIHSEIPNHYRMYAMPQIAYPSLALPYGPIGMCGINIRQLTMFQSRATRLSKPHQLVA